LLNSEIRFLFTPKQSGYSKFVNNPLDFGKIGFKVALTSGYQLDFAIKSFVMIKENQAILKKVIHEQNA
jgi:hypothetical protein